jgi:hypothetical protein
VLAPVEGAAGGLTAGSDAVPAFADAAAVVSTVEPSSSEPHAGKSMAAADITQTDARMRWRLTDLCHVSSPFKTVSSSCGVIGGRATDFVGARH